MKQNEFDKLLKETLNRQEYPFQEGDWSSFEQKLNKSNPASSPNHSKWWIGGSAAVVAIAITGALWLNSGNKDNSIANNNEEIVNTNSEKIASQKDNFNKEIEHVKTEENIETSEGNDQTNLATSTTSDNTSEVKGKQTTSNHNTNQTGTTLTTTSNNETSNKTHEDISANSQETEDTQDKTSSNSSNTISIPAAMIMVGRNDICVGEAISFETFTQNDVEYLWSFGDGQFSDSPNPSHAYEKPGSYEVTLKITSSKDHSIVSKSKEINIDVNPIPDSDFDYKEENNVTVTTLTFSPKSIDNSLTWEFGDGSDSKELSPSHSYTKKGYYNVTLICQNHYGCLSKTSKKIAIKEDYNLLAPNSFTPNGDGINDYFIPEALKTIEGQFTMIIYSQSEGLIYETKNINQQWDGINQQNGNICSEGTYIWVVNLTTSEGKTEQYKGAVLLLR